MRKSFLLLLYLIVVVYATAGVPIGYYRKAEGLKGLRLKSALHDIIQPSFVLSYGGGDGKTWYGFYQTDYVRNGQVRDRYSDVIRYFNKDYSAVNNMNIEHIWANSWWGHIVNNAYCDLFNLYPADSKANGRKSNNPIGVVDGEVSFTNDVVKVGKSSSYSSLQSITAWEPADEWKGDFARTYFYMATCYSHFTNIWTTTEGLLTVDPESELTMRPWVYNLMLEWAKDDPLDEIEKNRNEAIYQIQGNRNPYVDYPDLCNYIWGSQQQEQFYTDSSVDPEVFVPLADKECDMGLQALSRGFQTSLQVRGRNMSDGVSLSVDNADFILGTDHLSAGQLQEGYDVPLSVKADKEGAYTANLTIKGTGYEQETPLRVTFVDGIPAYEATDIVCSVSSRHFNANWMKYEVGATYTLDVYTKDAMGHVVSFGTYTTTDTTYQVKNVLPDTTYYYKVSIVENDKVKVSSNEVLVKIPKVTPVFAVSPTEISVSALPEQPSASTLVSITALAVPKFESHVSVTTPFEVSVDGDSWSESVVVEGSSQSFYVRFGGSEEEGEYDGEVIVSTEGIEERIISVSCSVDAAKSFFENFEIGTKGGYATGEVTCNAATWKMSNALLAGDDNARDKKCVRMKGGTTATPGYIMMMEDKEGGCDSLWFYAGLFRSDTGVKMTVSYSLDGGENWTPVVSGLSVSTMRRYGYKLDVQGKVRLKFENDNTGGNRINIDDVQMSDYGMEDGLNDAQIATPASSASYDLSGRRVHGKMKGVMVTEGKKILR